MNDSELKISPPLFLVGMKIHCWNCNSRMSAIALVAKDVEGLDEQVCVLSDITSLPREVLVYVQKRVPTFRLKYSNTVGHKYYANTCSKCGSLSGDFYLHSEPGAPFFPMDEDEAKSLYMTEIPLHGPITVGSSWGVGTGELIIRHAQKIS
jgi:hypothetical protein